MSMMTLIPHHSLPKRPGMVNSPFWHGLCSARATTIINSAT
jgi:hypothetical protein